MKPARATPPSDVGSGTSALRALPSVSRLLTLPPVRELGETLPQVLLTAVAREILDRARAAIRAAEADACGELPTPEGLARQVAREAMRQAAPSLRPAINATGVVLHTGLGRARLAREACDAVAAVASDHSMVEIDADSGRRGSRRDHVRGLLQELTGAEDAAVVNNCAGAVFLAVSTLAQGREVVISRGELVEIGGAFRMPDIIRSAGATLVEVGTTNRTRLSDYAAALSERTGLILRCHPSNFAIVGFTEETPMRDLVELGKQHGVPVMEDQGNGALLDLAPGHPTLSHSVRAGSDVVTASGDKLLGGPQAGLILGSTAAVDRMVRHPLARALRVDKLTLAALEATLRLYRDPTVARQSIPTLRYLGRQETELRQMARRLRSRIRAVVPSEALSVELVADRSEVGGGSLSLAALPTVCVALRAPEGRLPAQTIAARLRANTPPVFARIKEDAVLLDPRTLEAHEIGEVAAAVARMFQETE